MNMIFRNTQRQASVPIAAVMFPGGGRGAPDREEQAFKRLKPKKTD